ncbi:MAG: methyltransferase domain-containing protein [Ruminococcus sp.]|nr:methyltransferase domain-containing protein [Ruminococcus sp.]
MGILICPVCGEKLDISGNSYSCCKGHCFDAAKSGYVNLLLSKHMGKTVHGDNKLMVQARRDFLEKGYYSRLSELLCRTVKKYFHGGTILDAGCGEGYYTSAIKAAAGERADIYGIDISKTAVDMAAKRNKDITYATASVFHIPAADRSCDMLVTLFAPYCGEEFGRVLKDGGIMIMVIPSELHLWEMKQAIYDTPYKNEVKPYELEGFSLCGKQKLRYTIDLDNAADIQSLFSMTPYYYKTGREQQERLSALEKLTTTVDFEVLTYRKK